MSATYDIAALPGEIAVRRSRAYPRQGELISIMLLAMAFALGLGLLYAARSHDAAGQEAEAASLNDSKDSEKLLQALHQVIPGEEEARHARGQIIQRAAQRPYQNAGELRFLRVPAAELGAVGTTDKLIPLLTAVQFTRLKPRVRVRSGADYARLYWWCVAAFNAAFLIAHLILVWRAPNADQILIPAVMLVAGAALMLQISMRDPLRDSPSYLMFATGLLFAIPLAATLAGVNLERTTRFYIWSPLFLALALSAVLLFFGSGPAGSGTRVNLRLFGTTVQPSEWIRLLITFFLAGFLYDRAALIRNRPVRWLPPRWHGLIPHPVDVVPVAAAFLLCAGMFRGMRDLGPALMLAVAFSVCYVFARGKFLFVTAAFALSGAGIMWLLANHPAALGTAAGRIAMMASPFDNTVRGGDHLANGFWALAAGGFSGQGPGLGFTSELTNANNDFILGAIGEDLGFFGLLCVVGAAVLIVLRTIRTARLSPSRYQFFLGIAAVCQVGTPMSLLGLGSVGLFPLSGVSFPFASAGMSALLADGVLLGAILSVSAKHQDGYSLPYKTPLRVLSAGFGVVLALFIGQVFRVQVVQKDPISLRPARTLSWNKLPDGSQPIVTVANPRFRRVEMLVPRGTVYDRNGIPLASNDLALVARHRPEVESLGIDYTASVHSTESRHYPFNRYTALFLGDLRHPLLTQTGSQVERSLNRTLRGWADDEELLTLVRRRLVSNDVEVSTIVNKNRDVHLSVDIGLQVKLTQAVEAEVQRQGHRKAAVVVERSGTGEILASVSLPDLANDDFPDNGDRDELIDRAQRGLYPPGSTMKIASAIALMRQDPSLAQLTYACERLPGEARVGAIVPGYRRPVRDDIKDSPHGRLNLAEALVVSCNAWFAQAVSGNVPPERYIDTLKTLGFEVGNHLTAARLLPVYPWTAFGQGELVVRPVEMVRLANVIADAGVLPQETWAKADGPVNTKRVLVQSSAEVIGQAMRDAVMRGTAKAERANPLEIAGKTGTAELSSRSGGSHAWFVGYAPYQGTNQVSVAAMVEHGGYGATAALPLASIALRLAKDEGLMEGKR